MIVERTGNDRRFCEVCFALILLVNVAMTAVYIQERGEWLIGVGLAVVWGWWGWSLTTELLRTK